MRTRTPVVLLIVSALIASALGSIAAVAVSVGQADACSVAGPSAFASPTDGLRPGDTIEISGFGFYDLIFHDDQAQPDDIPGDIAVPPQLCDFDLVPMRGIEIVWEGTSYQTLSVVDGPEFVTRVQVPADADGRAQITIRNVVIDVFVGPNSDPPPPPPPPPCPLYPGTDSAPGILPPCPEPCVDYAHTTDDGTVYDYQWDCPDPCGVEWAVPGAAGETKADNQAELAIWCPPPPPEPCPLYAAYAGQPSQDLAIWCPDPCLHYLADDAVASAPIGVCPDPCGRGLDEPAQGLAAVWCPGPCELVGGDAWSCPESLPDQTLPAEPLPAEPLPAGTVPAEPLSAGTVPVEPLPAETAATATEPAVAPGSSRVEHERLVVLLARRIVELIEPARWVYFG